MMKKKIFLYFASAAEYTDVLTEKWRPIIHSFFNAIISSFRFLFFTIIICMDTSAFSTRDRISVSQCGSRKMAPRSAAPSGSVFVVVEMKAL